MGRTLGCCSSKIREPVIQERKDNPYMTMQTIANKFNISRQRVHQFLKQKGVMTRRILPKHPCLQCKKEILLRRKFCNRKCQFEFHRITLICDECGKAFKRRLSNAFYTLRKPRTPKAPIKLWFCNRVCQGKHIVKYRAVIPVNQQ